MADRCLITKDIEWDSGHRVMAHGSKCRNPHGHRYRLEVTCGGQIVEEPGSPDDGMLVDFGDLKGLMMELVHDVLDHGFICQQGDPLHDFLEDASIAIDPERPWRLIEFPYAPTAENIARWCWDRLEGPIERCFRDGLRLVSVKVWETPTSTAMFAGPG